MTAPGGARHAVILQDGIPVTTPTQTLLDLAVELPRLELERAVNDADKLDLIGPEELRESLDVHVGEPGVNALRILLDRHTFRLSDSDLEVLFRPIASAAGLPPPLTKEVVNGFEVDFFWPELGLVVETDGLCYHRTPSARPTFVPSERVQSRQRSLGRNTFQKFSVVKSQVRESSRGRLARLKFFTPPRPTDLDGFVLAFLNHSDNFHV